MEHTREFYDVMVRCGMNPPPFEAWAAHFSQNSELWPIGDGGNPPKIVGGVLFKGHCPHIAVLPEYRGRWLTKRVRRAYDAWTHDVPIVAAIPPENREAIELVRRLGWRRDADQHGLEIYVKEATCHQ